MDYRPDIECIAQKITDINTEVGKVIFGQEQIRTYSIAGMLANIHILVEGEPGTGKSLLVDTLRRVIDGFKTRRIQMSPDVKPMTLTGVKIWDPAIGQHRLVEGPLCGHHFIQFDELNRASPKTLAAALSAMQERRVYIDGEEITLPDPFFVMATQNDNNDEDSEGIYPLSSANTDRFGLKLYSPHGSAEQEKKLLLSDAHDRLNPDEVAQKVCTLDEIRRMRTDIKQLVFVAPAAIEYMVAITRAVRPGTEQFQQVCAKEPAYAKLLAKGPSIRAGQAMRGVARVLAATRGRNYVLPDEVQELALPALRHRARLSFEAACDGWTADKVVQTALKHVQFHKDPKQYMPPST